MNFKNILTLLLISSASPVAINAMSQAEVITRNFIEDCKLPNYKEHLERIKNGRIGIEVGRKLERLTKVTWNAAENNPVDHIERELDRARRTINKITSTSNDAQYIETAIPLIQNIRDTINHRYNEYLQGKYNYAIIKQARPENPAPLSDWVFTK